MWLWLAGRQKCLPLFRNLKTGFLHRFSVRNIMQCNVSSLIFAYQPNLNISRKELTKYKDALLAGYLKLGFSLFHYLQWYIQSYFEKGISFPNKSQTNSSLLLSFRIQPKISSSVRLPTHPSKISSKTAKTQRFRESIIFLKRTLFKLRSKGLKMLSQGKLLFAHRSLTSPHPSAVFTPFNLLYLILATLFLTLPKSTSIFTSTSTRSIPTSTHQLHPTF